MLRLLLLALLALALAPAAAHAMASHRGWPPYDGMLLMNEADSDRPLDARTGRAVFGAEPRRSGCKDTSDAPSSSCEPWLRRTESGYAVRATRAHHRLYGGHGDDRIHAGPNGDVVWGDYKPSGQPTDQRDRLWGGAGPDFIYTSHGRNTVVAGAGTDIVHAHFGHGTIDCGAGRDVVYVHGGHRRAFKRRHCEVVTTRTGESAPAWALAQLPWRITDTQRRR